MSAAVAAGEAPQEETVTYGACSVKVHASWRVGIGGKTWSTGALACRHLAAHGERFKALAPGRPLRCLELGAGTGVAGLFAAKSLGASVVLTDCADHLELLRANVALNAVDSVSVQRFDWTDETSWDLSTAPDLILCTDNAYHPSLYEPLVNALARCLARGAKCLFGVTKTDTSFAFFELLTARGLDYRFAEAPDDDYYALLAIAARPGFEARRDAWEAR